MPLRMVSGCIFWFVVHGLPLNADLLVRQNHSDAFERFDHWYVLH